MKCDELTAIKVILNNHGKPMASIQGTTRYYGISPYNTFYPQDEVDAAIAELKAKLYEAEEARIEAGADAADYYQENRKLKRALYKACSNWARSERYTEATWHGDEHREKLWAKVEVKCLKKAEECK